MIAWLFDRLNLDPALAGDLLEERASGRSASWYWTQVSAAIAIAIWSAVRSHKLLALRAILTGCAVNAVALLLWQKFLPIGVSTVPKLSLESIASLSLIFVSQAATGWIVARTHRQCPIPMVVVFALWLLGWDLANNFSHLKMLLVDSIDQPRFRLYLVWYLTPISTVVTSLLLGGVLGARPSSSSPRA